MEPTAIHPIAEILSASGPYGLVAILGWAFWFTNEKKGRQMRELFNRVAALSEAQTAATVKVEAALVALKEAISNISKDAAA